MSLLSEIKPQKGSTHFKKRIGRGIGSGMGGTSTKGHKGQLARTGGVVRRGFEGGQTPLSRRLPKFGFTNKSFATKIEILNLDQINHFNSSVDPELIFKSRLVKNKVKIKILGKGEITKALTIKAHFFSKSAIQKIEAVGGKVEVIK